MRVASTLVQICIVIGCMICIIIGSTCIGLKSYDTCGNQTTAISMLCCGVIVFSISGAITYVCHKSDEKNNDKYERLQIV